MSKRKASYGPVDVEAFYAETITGSDMGIMRPGALSRWKEEGVTELRYKVPSLNRVCFDMTSLTP